MKTRLPNFLVRLDLSRSEKTIKSDGTVMKMQIVGITWFSHEMSGDSVGLHGSYESSGGSEGVCGPRVKSIMVSPIGGGVQGPL